MEMQELAEQRDIVIVGGGICGLATALALHRKGIKSLVLERSKTLRSTGAAIIVQPNGWRALDQLGVATRLRRTAITIQGGHYISLADSKKKEIPIGNGEVRCLKRTHLIETLANDLPVDTIRYECQVVSIKLDPLTCYPVLQLHNGSYLQAKLVIGCDGVNSVIANSIGLNSVKLFCTCVVRGLTNYQNGHKFKPEFVVMSKGRVQLGWMPMTDKLVYWFVTRQWTSQDLAVSKNSMLIRQSTMETMKDFPDDMMEMISTCYLNSLHLTDLKYRAPWDLLGNNFHEGTVTVAGDAMHAMGPFLAQGGSASLEDAIVLGRCLAQKMNIMNQRERSSIVKMMVEEALEEYAKERKMRIVWLSLETYLIGKMLDAKSVMVKFVIIIVMAVLFSDPIGNTRYDCGRL
ncbi:FAD-dependent urate hydroxylase-like [Quillaja saponaria]|uniref:FAD-dependent urate hydroxylase-like n=1 Tax=Quillaja saponaria TaxID=32244 RepID=A0AAD7QJB5_QUISA|nr:FAD-dependent urate hydroxylase-like [Quillaja saponaria]